MKIIGSEYQIGQLTLMGLIPILQVISRVQNFWLAIWIPLICLCIGAQIYLLRYRQVNRMLLISIQMLKTGLIFLATMQSLKYLSYLTLQIEILWIFKTYLTTFKRMYLIIIINIFEILQVQSFQFSDIVNYIGIIISVVILVIPSEEKLTEAEALAKKQQLFTINISYWLSGLNAMIIDTKFNIVLDYQILTSQELSCEPNEIRIIPQWVSIHYKQVRHKLESDLDGANYFTFKQDRKYHQIIRENSLFQECYFILLTGDLDTDDTNLEDVSSSLSHELSTCLNCITSLSDVLKNHEEISNEISDQFVIPVYQNAKQLELIVNNLKDYSQLISESFMLSVQRFNIITETDEIIDYFRLVANHKQLNISVITNLEQEVVWADKGRYCQVLYQLLANSVRFSQSGDIIVKVYEEYQNHIRIKVKDQGIGMSETECADLRQAFQLLKMKRVSKHSVGCGLGLFISNLIALQMNPEVGIEFKSVEGMGSKFEFSLINHRPKTRKPTTTLQFINRKTYQENQFQTFLKDGDFAYKGSIKTFRSIRSRVGSAIRSSCHKSEDFESQFQYEDCRIISPRKFQFSGRRLVLPMQAGKLDSSCCSKILIVDDEFFNIFVLQKILKQFTDNCDSAFNGALALNQIRQKMSKPCDTCENREYTLIFLDINMPVMDGYETVRMIKQMKFEQKVYCIANSAFSDLASKQKAFDSGMDFYFNKPLDLPLLRALIMKILHGQNILNQ